MVGPLSGTTDWAAAINGIDTVIHCAALTWIYPSDTDQSGFQTVNVDATRTLAEQAVAAGVTRLVFISSLTVNGKHSGAKPFRHDDVPNPASAYSRSKWDAEQALRAIEAEHGLEIIVVRPPRIIWPELTGNLALMAKLIRRGIPMPFGSLDKNARDNVSAGNLVAAIVKSATVSAAAGQTLLVSDNDPMSTRALLLRIGGIVGRKPRLLPVPAVVLEAAMGIIPQRLLGKLNRTEMLDELTRDLRVDGDFTRECLDWTPARYAPPPVA
jgi:nucleoside-diphosphate-sugar epimerase